MPESDRLRDKPITSGLLKGALNVVLHHNNIPRELKPSFTNDHVVSQDKIAYLIELANAYELELRDHFADDPAELEHRLSGLSAWIDLITGGDADEILEKYEPRDDEKASTRTPRNNILKVGSFAAKAWVRTAQQLHEDEDEIAVSDPVTEETHIESNVSEEAPVEDAKSIDENEHGITTEILPPITLEGYGSLRNTIIDLFEAKRLGHDPEYTASGLLLLCELEKLSTSKSVQALDAARRSVREKIALFGIRNKEENVDPELLAGVDFLRSLTSKTGMSPHVRPQFPRISELQAEVWREVDSVQKLEDARKFVQSRMAYALDALYPKIEGV